MVKRLTQGLMIKLAGLAALVVSLAVGAGPAMAAEIDFGSLSPSPGGCSSSGVNFVCANSQTFTFTPTGSTFTATGFNSPPLTPFTVPGALTLKPFGPGLNALQQSGIGENTSFPSAACSNVNCEIGGSASVAVVSNHLINDAIIGSVQSSPTVEMFQFFTGSSIATLAQFGPPQTLATCTHPVGIPEACLVTGFSTFAIGVQNQGSGDVLIVAASQPTPEPATLVLLGLGLFAAGFVRRRKQ